jgi:hypothetical protein
MPRGCLIEARAGASFSAKKEAKGLFSVDAAPGNCRLRRRQNGKSFLLLFFKKEESSFLTHHG